VSQRGGSIRSRSTGALGKGLGHLRPALDSFVTACWLGLNWRFRVLFFPVFFSPMKCAKYIWSCRGFFLYEVSTSIEHLTITEVLVTLYSYPAGFIVGYKGTCVAGIVLGGPCTPGDNSTKCRSGTECDADKTCSKFQYNCTTLPLGVGVGEP
jgi:hypothetical protein